MQNYALIEGDFLTQDNLQGNASAVVIGPGVADKLFGRRNGVVGETIRINGQPFRVVGLLESKGGGTFGSQDNQVIVPLTTAQTRLIHRSVLNEVDQLYVQATNAKSVPLATDQITQILRQRHRTPVGVDDFTVFSQADFLSIATTVTGVFTIFLGRDCGNIPAGGRDRDHEHHAGFGHRADPRDRPAQSARRARSGYPDPVPDRKFHAQPDRRHDRHPAGLVPGVHCGTDRGSHGQSFQPGHQPGCDPAGNACSQPQWGCSSEFTRPTGLPAWNRSKHCATNKLLPKRNK